MNGCQHYPIPVGKVYRVSCSRDSQNIKLCPYACNVKPSTLLAGVLQTPDKLSGLACVAINRIVTCTNFISKINSNSPVELC